MQTIPRTFLIILFASSLSFVASAVGTDEADESSNFVVDQKPAVAAEQLDLTSGDIKTDSTVQEPQNTEIALPDDDNAADLSLEKLFDEAVESYLNDDWENCIVGFEKAIKSYKEYRKGLVGCRRKCREESNAAKPIFAEDVEDLHFYEKKVRETLCLMKCKKTVLKKDIKAKIVAEEVEVKYIERRPYEYLHICYYQMKRHQDAANAIFTFLTVHPKEEQSLSNLRFYINLPDVVEDEVVDLETDPFLSMYRAGITAYNDENYPEVIEQLENSIRAFINAENDCRLYCEGPFDQGWHPEFTMSIANHFAFGLKCKRSCSYWLNNVNGEQRYDVLMDHYHYLQFAYFKVGKLKEACAAVESFLLFVPDDETVLRNKDYFLGLPEVKKRYFEPREEALSYVTRQQYELRIELYIQQEFNSLVDSTG